MKRKEGFLLFSGDRDLFLSSLPHVLSHGLSFRYCSLRLMFLGNSKSLLSIEMPDRVLWFIVFRNDAWFYLAKTRQSTTTPSLVGDGLKFAASYSHCYCIVPSATRVFMQKGSLRCRRLSHRTVSCVSPRQCIVVGGCLEVNNGDNYIICSLHRAELRWSNQEGAWAWGRSGSNDVPSSDLGTETAFLTGVVSGFPQIMEKVLGQYLKLYHDRLLPHPLQFIIN
jgi:hypothetical protein